MIPLRKIPAKVYPSPLTPSLRWESVASLQSEKLIGWNLNVDVVSKALVENIASLVCSTLGFSSNDA